MPLRAQQALPVVGFMHSGAAVPLAHLGAAFRKGLSDSGFVDGKNVTVEFRWAEGQLERLPELAADLVRRQVSVIFAGGGAEPALAAKAATSKIPIVFATGVDPVEVGLVASLSRPGGNITGVTFLINTLGRKELEALHHLRPEATVIAALINPNLATTASGHSPGAGSSLVDQHTSDSGGQLCRGRLPQVRLGNAPDRAPPTTQPPKLTLSASA